MHNITPMYRRPKATEQGDLLSVEGGIRKRKKVKRRTSMKREVWRNGGRRKIRKKQSTRGEERK